MRNIVLIASLAIVFFSCKSEPEVFRGFGDLELGADFLSLDVSGRFSETMSDEYFISELELPGGFGVVKNLNVTTHEGKICQVSFLTTGETDTNRLSQAASTLVRQKVPEMSAHPKLPKIEGFEIFQSQDEEVLLTVSKHAKRYAKPDVLSYEYLDKGALMRQFKQATAQTKSVLPK